MTPLQHDYVIHLQPIIAHPNEIRYYIKHQHGIDCFELTNDTPYLALPGEPWGVRSE